MINKILPVVYDRPTLTVRPDWPAWWPGQMIVLPCSNLLHLKEEETVILSENCCIRSSIWAWIRTAIKSLPDLQLCFNFSIGSIISDFLAFKSILNLNGLKYKKKSFMHANLSYAVNGSGMIFWISVELFLSPSFRDIYNSNELNFHI